MPVFMVRLIRSVIVRLIRKKCISNLFRHHFDDVSAYLFQDHKVRKAQLRSGTQSARFRVDHFTIFDKILHEVETQLKINPNFNVFVTGHSLGGALATLFSFHLAALNHPLINKNTITCISVASPKVGDGRFIDAFKLAERSGKIRLVRLVNSLDFVPHNPEVPDVICFTSILFILARHPAARFRHCGLRIKLSDKKMEISYPKTSHGFSQIATDLYKCTKCYATFILICVSNITFLNTKVPQEHKVTTYYSRVERFSEELRKYTIDQIYNLCSVNKKIITKNSPKPIHE